MYKKIKNLIEFKYENLYGISLWIYFFINTLRKMPISFWLLTLKLAIKRIFGRQVVIFYAETRSHLFNFEEIPSKAVNKFLNLDFLIVCGFSKTIDQTNINIDQFKFIYNVPAHAVGFLFCKYFISPTERFSKFTLAPFSVGIYLPHVIIDTDGVSKENAYDAYDFICCVGPHQIDNLYNILKRRRKYGKVLIPLGYPKLDRQIREFENLQIPTGSHLIYAPSLVNNLNVKLSSLRSFSSSILEILCRNGPTFFRPHPNSFSDRIDSKLIRNICDVHSKNVYFKLDQSIDYSKTYALSKIMITDLSGTGFTFAFSTGRPVIFFSPDADHEVGLNGIHFEGRESIGEVARSLADLQQKIDFISKNYTYYSKRIECYRSQVLFNVGNSSEYFLTAFSEIIRRDVSPDWVNV
jgi:hypothetical protein